MLIIENQDIVARRAVTGVLIPAPRRISYIQGKSLPPSDVIVELVVAVTFVSSYLYSKSSLSMSSVRVYKSSAERSDASYEPHGGQTFTGGLLLYSYELEK
jgi:hypothetical protein